MPNLLTPIKIAALELQNRLVLPPMATGLSNTLGDVTEKIVNHYADRSKGIGLIIVEHSYVALEGRLTLNQPGIHSDSLVPRWRRLVNIVHNEGSSIALQINHAGSSTTREVCGIQPLAPSPVILPGRGRELPRSMRKTEIDDVIGAFVDAAFRAMKAGFDAVEIHGAHGFLLNQFLSPLTNKRTDEYGGSLKNRVRLPLQIIQETKEKIGENHPILYRLGVDDMMPGGLTLNEGISAAVMMVDKGADIIDVSGGLIGSRHPSLRGPGFFVPQAAAVRKAAGVPVIGVGGIETAEEADEIIRSGIVDFVAVGRAVFRDPSWAYKAVNRLRAREDEQKRQELL